jgi:citron Rho-interacting kinase
VQVVHEKSTGDVYAMKVMKKSHILQQADAAFFLEERDIMAWTTSQWLTSLHYAFQDSSHLYLVMDFHPGGDLLSVMERNEGGMSESDARFYLAEIAAGLNDLHESGFVHRDIKPENVLITRSGHIKLVDFGSAARLGPEGKVVSNQRVNPLIDFA